MAPLTALLLGVLSAWQIAAQDTPIPSCIPGCVNQVRTQFAEYGCTNANDAGCLCWKPNFSYGIRDCGVSCGANDSNVRQQLVQAFCAVQHAANDSVIHHLNATDDAFDSCLDNRCELVFCCGGKDFVVCAIFVSIFVDNVNTHDPSMAASTTFDAAPETSSATAMNSPSTGLSGAAAAGVGVGVGAALIALAGVGVCLFMRNRKREPRESGDISKPLPGSGRTYPPSREPGSIEKYGNDIEMTSNRYEDMVPRQQPRTMV
ncbi:hypothetical protein CDD82_6352 [Ophiocordyceps australis]|uniref:CFEM domain-containing protein n=1 Tax=Ophiocordyceps australis TaxID=1399860 RepID=A0A2C5YQC6_9HYPO|nr:hypothetical protein CDD82_6352 [Ophiocordyceps australis]